MKNAKFDTHKNNLLYSMLLLNFNLNIIFPVIDLTHSLGQQTFLIHLVNKHTLYIVTHLSKRT